MYSKYHPWTWFLIISMALTAVTRSYVFVIDVLLILNIVVALVAIIIVLRVKEPVLYRSLLPAGLFVAMLFQLCVSCVVSYAVLFNAYAGEIINLAGGFVAGGVIAVGAVVFVAFTAINFIVVIKVSALVSNAAASCDKDSESGGFIAAINGVCKYTKGFEITGILLIVVNLGAGLVVGVTNRGMAFEDAAAVYLKLTFGAGIALMIPIVLTAAAIGILLSKAETTRVCNEA